MNFFNFLILLCLLAFASCVESDFDILDRTMSRLDDIETIQYESRFFGTEQDLVLWDDTTTFYFDLRESENIDVKYYLSNDEKGGVIYDGSELISILHQEKVIITNDTSNPYNPLMMTLLPLKEVLSALLEGEGVTIIQTKDTLIQGKKGVQFDFFMEKQFINWEERRLSDNFEEYEPIDNTFSLIVDKNTYFPILMTASNGKNGIVSRSIEEVDLNYKIDDKMWDDLDYFKIDGTPINEYTTYTFDEYFYARKSKSGSLVGTQITEWELPNLMGDSSVNMLELDADVTLFEFWFKGCGACIAAIPGLNQLQEKYKDQSFEMYGIEYNEQFPSDILQEYISKYDKKYPNLYKAKTFAEAHGVQGAPTIMIVNKTGEIVYIDFGFDEGQVEMTIEEHLKS